MNYILGVDGGGSKTIAKVIEASSGRSGIYEAGSSDYKSVGIKVAKENVTSSVLNSLNLVLNKLNFDISVNRPKISSACFGMSGLDCSYDYDIYRKMIFNTSLKDLLDEEKTIICNDTKIGLYAGSKNKNRVIIVCGTGSNCYGINEFGKEARANGWDYILGDEGSGYSIGLRALRAVMQFYDGRGPSTILKDLILKHLNLNEVLDLINWAYSSVKTKGLFLKERISKLAIIVEEAARMGDKTSIDIYLSEANEAIKSVEAVVNKLDISRKSFDCILSGGLFKCEEFFKAPLIKKLLSIFPKINIKPLNSHPVEGALILARNNL